MRKPRTFSDTLRAWEMAACSACCSALRAAVVRALLRAPLIFRCTARQAIIVCRICLWAGKVQQDIGQSLSGSIPPGQGNSDASVMCETKCSPC